MSLSIMIPKRDPEMDLRRSTILSMLRYMYSLKCSTKLTLQTIFDGITDYVTSIKCNLVFVVNERPIIYVKSITINNCEIPINMGFYKSTGKSRNDINIKDYWFPTTQLSYIANKCYRLNKPEDYYVIKYDNIYTLSTNVDEIIEQDMLLKYGRFINANNALVCCFLKNKNVVLSELVFEQCKIESNDYILNYTDFFNGPELIINCD